MNDQIMKLERVKKSCHTAKVITRALYILTRIAAILCVGGAALVYFFRDKIDAAIAAGEGSFNPTMNNLSAGGLFRLSLDVQKLFEQGNYTEGLITTLVFAGVMCLFTAIIFRMICRVFIEIEKSESPFAHASIFRLKKAFITLVILTGLFVDVGNALLLALFLWCVYCILDYGAALQTEIDETL